MSNKIDTRYAIGRKEANAYNTQELRDAFLVDTLMTQGEVVWIYTHYERFMLGSAVPTTSALTLETIEDQLKMPFFTAPPKLQKGIIAEPDFIRFQVVNLHDFDLISLQLFETFLDIRQHFSISPAERFTGEDAFGSPGFHCLADIGLRIHIRS